MRDCSGRWSISQTSVSSIAYRLAEWAGMTPAEQLAAMAAAMPALDLDAEQYEAPG
jgi:hypothetical protein